MTDATLAARITRGLCNVTNSEVAQEPRKQGAVVPREAPGAPVLAAAGAGAWRVEASQRRPSGSRLHPIAGHGGLLAGLGRALRYGPALCEISCFILKVKYCNLLHVAMFMFFTRISK